MSTPEWPKFEDTPDGAEYRRSLRQHNVDTASDSMDEWGRTLYSKLEALHGSVNALKIALYVLIVLVAVVLFKD